MSFRPLSAQDQSLENDWFGFEPVGEEAPAVNETVTPEAVASAASEGKEALPNFNGPIRSFAVWDLGQKPTGLKVGVWCHKWTLLCERLEGKRLIGSNVQLKAFDDVENAILYVQGRCSIHNGEDIEIFTNLDCENEYCRYCM